MSDFQRAVAAGGLAALEAIRDAVTADLDEVCGSMRDKAALYRKLLDVVAAIDKLRPPAEADEIDAIRNRRNRRVLGAAWVPLLRD